MSAVAQIYPRTGMQVLARRGRRIPRGRPAREHLHKSGTTDVPFLSMKTFATFLLISLIASEACALVPSLQRIALSGGLSFGSVQLQPRRINRRWRGLPPFAFSPGESVPPLMRLCGKETDEDDDDLSEVRKFDGTDRELQRKLEEQQRQINLLISMMKKQEEQEKQTPEKDASNDPPSVQSTFSKNYTPSSLGRQPQNLERSAASASVTPLKAMLFIDGTWLYYSIHERNELSCPIILKYGLGWQRKYYFDWTALPRIICQALQDQDSGWAVQSRPVEIVRASVFTSYKADTSPESHRFRMYQDMSNAHYDIHMMETIGRNEKCVDIQIAVEMLHYATVPNAYDVALLLTGDKDFIPAMIRTRQKGRRVGLVSMKSGCNRALYEAPTDENDNSEHNHNIRDYDVVWIEDYLDELIKPKTDESLGAHDRETVTTSSFTMMKVVSDFISKSGFNQVSSRDIGRYLKVLKIGNYVPTRSILDELKCFYGGLFQFFTMSECFEVTARDSEARDKDPHDKSYWVSFRSDADMTLVKAAREAKLSPAEKQFFDEYTLDPLNNKEEWYRHTIELARLENKSLWTSREPSTDKSIVNGDSDNSEHGRELEIPEELVRDYSTLTVPALKDYCRERGLKVSGTKSQLLDRIQEHNEQEVAKLKKDFSGSQNDQGHGEVSLASSQDNGSLSGSQTEMSYLTELVAEYLKAAGGQANSRDVGRYLAANKASPSYLSMNKSQARASALQQLKDMHGSLKGFIYDNSEHFEQREIDVDIYANQPGESHAFYVALVQQPISQNSSRQPLNSKAMK